MTPQELSAKTGEVIGTSDWFHVTQERINMFADATGDHQFIHIDEEKAKLTPFGGTIAHGFPDPLAAPRSGRDDRRRARQGVKMGVNYGGNKTRFLSPVRAGKRVRATPSCSNWSKSAPASGSRPMK
jgi:acyl dehydratase